MIRRTLACVVLAATIAGISPASAQIPIPRVRRGQPPPPPTIDMVRADFRARTGSDTVYFAGQGHVLDAQARATLSAQAQWLRSNPAIAVRIEGHADDRTTRDQALAVGERRADSVRDFLVLQGVPAAQIALISWGKERPAVEGSTDMALALNRRAVTVLMPAAAPPVPPAF